MNDIAERLGNLSAIALSAYTRTEDRVKEMFSGFQNHLHSNRSNYPAASGSAATYLLWPN
jgi:hypothetical protein